MLELSRESSLLSALRVAAVTGGRLLGGVGVARGLATDSRTVRPGDLFVALVGERHDGHNHLDEAIERGAEGLLVEHVSPSSDLRDVFVVVVDDTRAALLDLATEHRRAASGLTVVAITGSCGKTTTKEIAQHMLFPQLALVAAERSFNNDIGVPLTLLRTGPNTELCLLELGTNQRGEIARLAGAAGPDIALITMIGRAHLEGLGSLEGVLDEKGALLDALPRDGTAILNADDTSFAALRRRAGERRVVSFGLSPDAGVRADELRPLTDGVSFQLVTADGGNDIPVELPRFGLHDVRNCLAAVALGRTLGLEVQKLVADLPSLPSIPRRLELKRTVRGVQILDDTFNANPDSLLAALAVLDAWSGARRRILVLADMVELGPQSAEMHRSLGAQLAGRVDLLITLGSDAGLCAEAYLEETTRPDRVRSFSTLEDLAPELESMLREEDVVLFKGSRRMNLDRLVDQLVGVRSQPPLVSPLPVSYTPRST